MDIEQLSKSQIVLLTLLVSFVTSIATGIVTVSLMDQAPPSIAQTVNRVIRETVQTVTPAAQTSASAVTQQTVVVKESDLISQAVDKVTPSVVRLYSGNSSDAQFLGLGVVLDASGTVATDIAALGSSSDASVALSDGARVNASVSTRDSGTGIVYLSTATSTADGKTPSWTPVSVSDGHATLGETVVALSGNTVARIQDGIITSITPGQNGSAQVFDTGIAESAIMFGSPLIDTNGALVGLSTSVSRAATATGFVPAAVLLKQ